MSKYIVIWLPEQVSHPTFDDVARLEGYAATTESDDYSISEKAAAKLNATSDDETGHYYVVMAPKQTFADLKVYKKNVYGKMHVYPACDLSRGFINLLGGKTLTQANLKNIRSLGFNVVFESQPD